MQPKAVILAFIKPNWQVVQFFLKISIRADAASSKINNFQGYKQYYIVSEQAINVLYRYQHQDKYNQNSQNQL